MNGKYYINALLVIALFLTGCTKENLDNCFSGLKLDFDFTLHTNDMNLFGEKVQRVRVYLFDEKGVLQVYAIDNGIKLEYKYLKDGQIVNVSNPNPWGELPDDYVMNLEQVPPGKYTVVAWAGSGKGDNTTFFDGHMNDPITHDFQEGVTLGVTTEKDFRLFVKYNMAPDLPEDIVPIVDEIDDLWYGAVGTRNPITSVYTFETVEVKQGEITMRHVELIRDTNVLKVTVTGIDNLIPEIPGSRGAPVSLPDSGFKVWVVARNGRYLYNNQIGEYARSIRYNPFYSVVSDDKIVADIKILRLDIERHRAEPMYLYIESPDGKLFPSKPIDVVNILLQARDPKTGEYIYNSQSDFDKIYEHPIEIRINQQLEVTIYIGEWKIEYVKPADL